MERKLVVAFNAQRQGEPEYPQEVIENFSIKRFSFGSTAGSTAKLITEELKNNNPPFIIHSGGDGSLGFLLDVLYKAYPEGKNIPPLLLLGGGTANTTLRGLANLRDEENLPDDLVNIFPEEEFVVKSYRPLSLCLLDDAKQEKIAAYLAGFGHLTIGVTKIFEKIRGRINPTLAYLTDAILSLTNLHQRCQPQLLDFDDKSFPAKVKLAALAVLGVSHLATFSLNQEISNEDFLLLFLQGETEAELYLKYLTTLVVGGVFTGGVDWLIRRKVVNLQKGRQVSVLPDQEDNPNACIDGELKRFERPLTIKRAKSEVILIIPQEIVKRYKR